MWGIGCQSGTEERMMRSGLAGDLTVRRPSGQFNREESVFVYRGRISFEQLRFILPPEDRQHILLRDTPRILADDKPVCALDPRAGADIGWARGRSAAHKIEGDAV